MKKLKIVQVASEIAPFTKTGGLGDVTRSLPKALKRLGHEVVSITPLYGKIIDKKKYNLKLVFSNVKVYLNSKESVRVNYFQGYAMEGLPVYFIENTKYFSQRKNLYGSKHENSRFLVFNVAALKLISLLKFKADIVHCHDWQTGLIPYYLKTDFRYSKTLKKAKTIFTIHNLVFQFGKNWWEIPPQKKDYGHKRLPHLSSPDIDYINFAKRAILSADIINTVSEQYRDEIMTKKFGQDLHRILKNRRKKLFGIINGIDYNTYNPENDSNIFKNYNYNDTLNKDLNKEFIQNKYNLPINAEIPIICTTSRVTFQKGFDLILQTIDQLLNLDVQIIFMGDGDKNYLKPIKKLVKENPKKLVWLSFDNNKETLLYAGSDLFLLPSNHEPCGINQLIAMRYGCVPVVREVGGLYDTVENFDPGTKKGTGFTFKKENPFAFYGAIVRALEARKNKAIWKKILKRIMKESNSWEIPAKKYIELYKRVLR